MRRNWRALVKGENPKRLAWIVNRAPSNSSKSYGKPFLKIFQEANNDFYKIESDLFAPAAVSNRRCKDWSRNKKRQINVKMLKESSDISNH
jgi:methenyltetrahydromethanopterin cyclohydrolase